MDAQGTMRLMFDTMDAYDRGDFDRLGEIYAEDARWTNVDPKGPHCRNRDDIFTMFRERMASGVRVGFDELRSTPTHVVLTVRVDGFEPVVSVFGFEGRRIVTVADYPSMEAAESALVPRSRSPAGRWWRRRRPGSEPGS
jgi:ketosteroid isomerase-like protein